MEFCFPARNRIFVNRESYKNDDMNLTEFRLCARLPRMEKWLERIAPAPRIAGWSRYDGDWIEPLRVVHDPELVIFEDGEFVLECDGAARVCAAGTFAVIRPGSWHDTRMRSRHGLRRWMHFDWEPSDPGRPPLPVMTYWPGHPSAGTFSAIPSYVPDGNFFGIVSDPAAARSLHGRVEELLKDSAPERRALARVAALELMLGLLAPAPASANPLDDARDSLARRARHALDAIAYLPPASHPGVRTILGSLGRSYESACRAFRAAYGTTPVRYINALKMEKAEELLSTTDLPVAEIALRCGIENPTYFARLHRARFGRQASASRRRR